MSSQAVFNHSLYLYREIANYKFNPQGFTIFKSTENEVIGLLHLSPTWSENRKHLNLPWKMFFFSFFYIKTWIYNQRKGTAIKDA